VTWRPGKGRILGEKLHPHSPVGRDHQTIRCPRGDSRPTFPGAGPAVGLRPPFSQAPGNLLILIVGDSHLVCRAAGAVDFTWKDYRDHGKTKVMTLAANEFIRRFLLHTVPDGFHRIRHIGFLANGHRTGKLALCRTLLTAPEPAPAAPESYRERVQRLTGHALDACPECGGAMQERGPLPRRPPTPRPAWCDTS